MNAFQNTKITSFFGRTFSELLECYGIDIDSLAGKRVLDVAAGPSSFAAEANRMGITTTAVDPMYYRNVEALESLGKSDYEDMFRKMRLKSEFFAKKTFASIDEAEASRYSAFKVFLEDYELSYPSGRYLAGELPALPFEDNSFDVVFCSHLFFIYDFDFDFYRLAISELCRLAGEEIRIHPVVDSKGEVYEFLDDLLLCVKPQGFSGALVDVEHEFFKGSNQTLLLRR